MPWGALALAAAALYLGRRCPGTAAGRRRRGDAADAALAGLAVAVTAFVSLAVPLELERRG